MTKIDHIFDMLALKENIVGPKSGSPTLHFPLWPLSILFIIIYLL